MRGFPWFWEREGEGEAWVARMERGGPRGRRHHGGPGGPEGGPGFGPGGPRHGEERGERGPGWRPPVGPERLRQFGGMPFGGPFGGPFGFPPFGGKGRGRRGGWPPFGRGPKVRRGDVRAAALALLAEQPRNGYQIIQEIAERSGGLWKPSSGSVYPALQQLEDEGLVETATVDGRRTFQLTEAGQTYVEQHKAELTAPWETVTAGVDDSSLELHALLGQVAMATIQVAQVATPAQLARARQALMDTRRSLYQILADADGEDEVADAEEPSED